MLGTDPTNGACPPTGEYSCFIYLFAAILTSSDLSKLSGSKKLKREAAGFKNLTGGSLACRDKQNKMNNIMQLYGKERGKKRKRERGREKYKVREKKREKEKRGKD